MECRAAGRSAREDEPSQRRQLRFERIDPLLQPRHVVAGHRRLPDTLGDAMRRIGEPRADGEEITLDSLEHLDQLGVLE